ncbi:MAG: hypothetical protein M0P70_09085 [Desulfobulbaceae bacterium]|nr:hypothetical protein [Desulfobulbaceae bacterium]
MPGNDAKQLNRIRNIGLRLEKMYVDMMEDMDEDEEMVAAAETPASILARILENAPKEQMSRLLQFCSTEIKKS